ncbi:MAG: NAD(P)/FAD-dependent oxidoreductase [Lachnospiraceae bacterium]|nr:NAD(P)/FAD-dependent oxidoreductase [Lachnospiraceae bacterium]
MASEKKKAVIIGAGPAGLTAAYELLKRSSEYEVTVLEESDAFGGISKTVQYHGNRMDMGGHRFFSKVPRVNEWWEQMMPAQGAPAMDYKVLSRDSSLSKGGPDPEKQDRVMLIRNRLSRIYFKSRFFDYPISLKWETIKNMGFGTTFLVGLSYLKTKLCKREEKSLEDFYINRFGKKLYSMFFENYTQNLWGRHPSQISPEWGAQRAKGLSITAILKDMLGKLFHIKGRKVETSLIEQFYYPKLGPGQLWEITASEVEKLGGAILKNSKAVEIYRDPDGRISGVGYETDGTACRLDADLVISSMPLKDLVGGMQQVPEQIQKIAEGLPYRDYMTVGVLVKKLKLQNRTKIPTLGGIVPDNWVYVHDRSVHMGRFQIFNNWSPYMVADPEHTVWMGLEYFCNEGDRMWTMPDEKFAKAAIREMVKIGLIEKAEDVTDFHVERIKKAYPAYFDTYDRIDELRAFLDTIPNLYCVGRNGQHRYNNLDHSMCTSFEAVDNIIAGISTKENLWNVNTEQEYHEGKA